MAMTPSTGPTSGRRRVLVGTNVTIVTVAFAAIVVIAQLFAYEMPVRLDMTSSGVNSLAPETTNLLNALEKNLRLTSCYFETDMENEDQQRYRRSVQDLLDLYEARNRGKITADWINPLEDHEKFTKLMTRLREKPQFAEGIIAYKERVDAFRSKLSGEILALFQQELDLSAKGLGGGIGESGGPSAIAQIEELLHRLKADLEDTQKQAETFTASEPPQYSAAVNEIKTFYGRISKSLKEIGKFAVAELTRNPSVSTEQAEFLRGANSRYAELVGEIESETTALQDLKPLKVDDLVDQIGRTANAIVVETDDDASVVDFNSVWPPQDGSGAGRAGFHQRTFRGEEKINAAILHATHKERAAVVFVRYGGQPFFMGGFMPGQPPSAYSGMKQQLEDANFTVEEWDLKTKDTPPEIDPKPTRTIFVVHKPETQQRNPMMQQQPPEAPFTEAHRDILLKAMGDNGRALFVAGWHPGPFGPIPASYEFNEYLKETWGINVDTSALLIEVQSIAPGKYGVTRRDFFNMEEPQVGSHAIIKGSATSPMGLPWAAPLQLLPPPEGVEQTKLVTLPKRDGVWGVKNIQAYEEQMQTQQFLSRIDTDLEGPFDLAVAAQKGDTKIVIVSSRDFAKDAVALALVPVLTSQSLTIRSRYPGNVQLFLNSLHWLNDKTEWMNLGRTIDAAVLEIPNSATERVVKVLTIFAWPALALACGGAVWWVRRR